MNIRLLLGVSAILFGPASDLSARTIVLNTSVAINHGVGLAQFATNIPSALTDRVIANPGPVVDRRNLMKLAGSKPGGTGDGYGE